MKVEHVRILIIAALLFAVCLAFQGCAVITPTYDEQGRIVDITSKKFLADLTYESFSSTEYGPDGKTVIKVTNSMKMETKTNADRIMGEIVKGAGVVVDGAGKLMP